MISVLATQELMANQLGLMQIAPEELVQSKFFNVKF
jgi:hypothetical protein